MGIYYILLLALAAGQLLGEVLVRSDRLTRHTAVKSWLVYAWVCLSALQGLRGYTVGVDTSNYVKYFVAEDLSRFEWGYRLVCKGLYLVTHNPTVLLCVMALLINGLILHAVYRMSTQPYVSVYCYLFFYYYLNSYNVMRQYVAVAFLLNALYYVRKRQWKWYFLCLFLACGFHSTAIVGLCLLLIPFLEQRPIQREHYAEFLKHVLIILALSVLAVAAIDIGIRLMVMLLPQYAGYVKTSYFTSRGSINKPIVYLALYAAFFFLVNHRSPQYRQWKYPLYLVAGLSVLQMPVAMVARILWYFDLYLIFAVSVIWTDNILENRSKPLLKAGIVLVGLAFMTYYLRLDMQGVKNYYFAFLQ